MNYKIKAYREPGGVSVLHLPAASREEAVRHAEAQGWRVISLRRQMAWSLRLGARQRFSVALFSQELLGLLEAGLSLVEAIDILARKSRQSESKKILETLTRDLREGRSLSASFESLPEAFPSLYVATIRTSEHTGDLEQALRRYLDYHRQLNLVRDKVVAASIYPALLVSVGTLVLLFLMGYVIPRFSRVYDDMGQDKLPWVSRLMMQWGQLFSQYALWIMGGLGVAACLLVFGLTRPATRGWMERRLWAIPALGEQMRLYQLARFTRTLAMLLNGGIPFVTALDMVRDLLRQPALREGLQKSLTSVREGRSVSDTFAANALATEVGVRLLAVGERSGELGRSLERIAKLYDDELARWIDWFSKLFEPILMLVIGTLIGLVVLLMYLPIFELASTIQ
jgi:general secretion pathway protein F